MGFFERVLPSKGPFSLLSGTTGPDGKLAEQRQWDGLQSHEALERKIQELEEVTSELAKNKDLLVEAERYSAVGHMAAQLAHSIRNPITAIGGTARLLARKIENRDWLQFLGMMASEAEKIENNTRPCGKERSKNGLIPYPPPRDNYS